MRLLIIDDNPDDRELLRRAVPYLRDVQEAGSLEQARQILAAEQIDCILLDLHLPDASARDGSILAAIVELRAAAPVICVTGHSLDDCPELVTQVRSAGAVRFTSKELVAHAPNSLAREIDWALGAAAGIPPSAGLLELRRRSLASLAPSQFDPNSVQALIADMKVRLEELLREHRSDSVSVSARLGELLAKGESAAREVVELQKWRGQVEERWKYALRVCSAVVVIVGFVFGPQLRDRAMIDTASVRRLADEQIASASVKSHAPAGGSTPPGTP